MKEEWKQLSMNRILRLRSGDFIAAEDIESDGTFPVFGGNGLRGFTENWNTNGPLVLIGRQGAHCGNIHIAEGQCWVSEHALRCLPEKKYDPAWLAYCLRHMNLNQYSVSAAQPGLSTDNLKSLNIAFPPLETQRRIAHFLDEKTERIDALIEKKRALLDRLAEKRQALITRAVTKGLNPDASMRPSGIDWLGDIPAHWEVMPLNRITRMRSGDFIASSGIEADGKHLVFGGNGVRGYTEDFNTIGPIALVGRQGAQCGNVQIAYGKVWVSEHSLRCIPEKDFDVKWLFYVLGTMNLNKYSVSAAQPGLSVDNLKHLRTVLPPVKEQRLLTTQLDAHCLLIEKIAAETHKSLNLLGEYRSALITAAVTGQLEIP